jgi:hypothetical protein
MSTLGIDLGALNFKPGDRIDGRVSWQLERPPESAELRLFWYTKGKGTQDVENVDSASFATPQIHDERLFSFTLPAQPFSFSGQLISIVWALELLVEPGGHVERLEFVMSPTGREVVPGEGA